MFYVFVDTQAFRKAAFAFNTSTALVALRNAVADGRVTVLMTSITEREIKRLLAKELTVAFQAVKKAIKDNYFLRTVPVVDLGAIRETSKEVAVTKAMELWGQYRTAIAPTMVDFDNVRPSDVMNDHFEENPPFSTSKPDEFRDAFVLRALYEWAQEQDQEVMVVSGDPDHAATCDGERLHHVPTIEDAIARSRNDAALEQQARDAILGKEDIIKDLLQERFEEIPISIEDDFEADAEDQKIESVDVDPDGFVLVEFRNGHVVVSGNVRVHYSFTSTISDYANGSRDEGDWVYLPHYTYSIRATTDARISIRMPFGGSPAEPGEIEAVTIESPKRISLGLDDSDVESEVTGDHLDDDRDDD